MALLRLCAAFGVLLASAHCAAVTPIEKVITLLEDLQADIEAKGADEAASYGKFACFCKDTTTTKSDAIKESQDSIDQCNAFIEEKTAEKKEKEEKLLEEKRIIEETAIELKKITEVYEKAKAEYEAKIADLSKAISSAKKAHDFLSKSKPSFLDLGAMKSVVRECLSLADALGVLGQTDQKAVQSFLQVDPEDPAYKFHSGKILEIIKNLENDFKEEKSDIQDKWKLTDETYKKEKSTLEDKKKAAEEEVEKLKGEISDLEEKIAAKKGDLLAAESALKDDSAYLKDLTVRCEEKGKIWDQRTKTRHDENEAITQALKILKDQDADTINKRAMLIEEKPLAAPIKRVAAPAEAVEFHEEATPANWKPKVTPMEAPKPAADAKPKKASFLQMVSQSESDKLKDALAILRHESVRLGSTMLSSVATQIAKDPFVKIKKLIQGLIERMLQESKDEATKKGFCDTELGKSYEDRKNRYAEVNKLDADIEDLEAQRDKLELEIEELTEDIKKLKEDLEKAEEARKEEKEANLKLVKDAQEGATAVADALVILKDFYKNAAKNAFVQVAASPVEEDDPSAGFSGKYAGQQDSSKAILGLLQVIKSDYERTERVTEAEEADAHKKWIMFERTSKSDIAAKTEKQSLDEQDLDSTKTALTSGMEDLQTATNLLDAALKNIEDLKPTCLDTGMSYKERVQKREEEISALKEACKALVADGGVNDCP